MAADQIYTESYGPEVGRRNLLRVRHARKVTYEPIRVNLAYNLPWSVNCTDVGSVDGDHHHGGDSNPKPDRIRASAGPITAIQGASEDYHEDQSHHILQTYNHWLDSTMALQRLVTSNR